MIFSKLLPHEGNFFELTSRHSDCIVDAARNFCQLVMNYPDRRPLHNPPEAQQTMFQ